MVSPSWRWRARRPARWAAACRWARAAAFSSRAWSVSSRRASPADALRTQAHGVRFGDGEEAAGPVDFPGVAVQRFQVLANRFQAVPGDLENVLTFLDLDGLHLGVAGGRLERLRFVTAGGGFRCEPGQFVGEAGVGFLVGEEPAGGFR